MKQIDIYIHTLTHSRGKGPAVYKSVLEFVKSDGEVCTLEVTGADKETTTNRITTEAVVMALRRIKLNQPYKIRCGFRLFHTDVKDYESVCRT